MSNRIVKFRGKSLKNGEWLYGDLIHVDKSDMGIVTDYDHWQGCRVDPSTVGQFTGLYDRNGKEIYEGDVLLMTSCRLREHCIVEWHSKEAKWCISLKIAGKWLLGLRALGDWMNEADFSIIGNRFDNPELLSPAATCKDEWVW